MAEEANNSSSEMKGLLKVLVLGPPQCFTSIQTLYSHKFSFLKPHLSHLSLQCFLHHHTPPSIAAVLCGANYSVTAEVLRLLPSLRLVVTASAGTNHIDLRECRCRGIQVAGAGALFSEDVADTAVALLIDGMRKISAADRWLRTQNRRNTPWDLFPLGSKVCIISYIIILLLFFYGLLVSFEFEVEFKSIVEIKMNKKDLLLDKKS